MEDSFNEGMLCITHFVFLHNILRRSQMLVTYNRLPDDVVLCAEVTYNNKVKSKIKYYTSDHFQYCFRFTLHSQSSSHNFYTLFLNVSIFLCCIDCCTENSPWCRLRKEGWHKTTFIQLGTMILVGIKWSTVLMILLKLCWYL